MKDDVSEYELREPADLFLSGDEVVSQEGERESAAELGGDGLDFVTGIDIEREPMSAAKVGTVVNEENALDVAMAIARDVESEVLVGDIWYKLILGFIVDICNQMLILGRVVDIWHKLLTLYSFFNAARRSRCSPLFCRGSNI